MISWSKLQRMSETDEWLIDALEQSRHCDDERSLQKRAKESIAFIAFKPFKQADPFWIGQIEFQPFFHSSRMAGSNGCTYTSLPLVVCHLEWSTDYYCRKLLPSGDPSCDCSVELCMRGLMQERSDGLKVTFDAIVKPLQVKLNPHRMFAESYEIFKFPEDFQFEKWVSDAKAEKQAAAERMGRKPYFRQRVEA